VLAVLLIDCSDATAATPSPTLAYDKILGVFFGNEPSAVAPFEQWFGRPVGGILAYGNHDNWEAFDSSIPYNVYLWSRTNRRVLWSIPLIVKGATLEQAAAGIYNDHYRRAAKTINAFRPGDTDLYIRTGWEFNGDWFPWAAAGKTAAFRGAYRQFVRTFRSVSPRFKFEWTPNIGNKGMNPEIAYPGDDVVDIIGMDVYYNRTWDSLSGKNAFNYKMTEQYGLRWHKNFSAIHRKPMAYS
jgi:Glycosyl hydrolase family 26